MYSITLPDETVVELSAGDAYSGPGDCFSKLHVNSNAVFFRVNGGTWQHCCERSMHKARQMLELCENVQDLEVLNIRP